MQVAPIRSPIDLQRARLRLAALSECALGSLEAVESSALRDAIDHYQCIVGQPETQKKIIRVAEKRS